MFNLTFGEIIFLTVAILALVEILTPILQFLNKILGYLEKKVFKGVQELKTKRFKRR